MSAFHNSLRAVVHSLTRRAKWAGWGVYHPGRPVRSIRVAGKRVPLSFPESERGCHEWELQEILCGDCYRLASVDRKARTILDIGANVGLFALAARRYFGRAAIHCYEPNPAVLPYLTSNCAKIGAHIHQAAVGETAGFVSLENRCSSLHTTTNASPAGTIPMESFSSIVNRLGTIDLLKLDCEGAEWEVFRCKEAWQNIRAVVMEYHLSAKPGSSSADVRAQLRENGFSVIEVEPNPEGSYGFAWARRS